MGSASAPKVNAGCTRMLQARDVALALAAVLARAANVGLAVVKVGKDQNWSIDIDNPFRRSMVWHRIPAVQLVLHPQILAPVGIVGEMKAPCQF